MYTRPARRSSRKTKDPTVTPTIRGVLDGRAEEDTFCFEVEEAETEETERVWDPEEDSGRL